MFLNSIRENVWAGGENLFYNCATQLSRKGHKIWVAGRKNSEFLKHFSPKEINLIPLKIRGDFDPVNIFSLARLISSEKIDFIWVNFNKDLRIGGIAAKLAQKAKIIWRMGGLFPENSLVHKLTGRFLPDKIIVPSEFIKTGLERYPWIKPEKVKVIPNGIDLSYFDFDLKKEREKLFRQYNLDPCTTLIGIPARLIEAKGHQYLLQAIPDIIRVFPKVKFFFAGDGSERENLQNLVGKLNLNNYVIFAGYIREIFEIIAGFDLVVVPSINESFGLAVAEGMALKKPVVSTLVGGIPEVVENQKTGLLVPPKDPHSLALAIISLLKDKNLAFHLGEEGRKRVEKLFTIEKMIDKIEALLGEMSR